MTRRNRATDNKRSRTGRPSGKTYMIRRFYADDTHEGHQMVVATGLTLREARKHCGDPSASETDGAGRLVWFDGYEPE